MNTGLPVYETGALTAELKAHGGAGRETRTPNRLITNQLRYLLRHTSIIMAGVDRVELPQTESKSVALPLGDTPMCGTVATYD